MLFRSKTINKYLGRDYKVVASMGHVRDLPKSKLGVDIDNGFTEEYEALVSRKKVIKELKDAAKEASEITVLQAYLPQRLSADEVAAQVAAIVAELGAAGPGDMGKVMAAAKARLGGQAEMAQVSAAVKAALSK